jgi:hypothetical protein
MSPTFTPDELAQMGYRLEGGRAVRVGHGPADTQEPEMHWKEMQRRVRRVFIGAGCTVYWLSQARRSGQTPGLPDLIVFGPPGAPWGLMWETKAGRGETSAAQRTFAQHCARVGWCYRSGGESAARRFLREQSVAAPHPEGRTA